MTTAPIRPSFPGIATSDDVSEVFPSSARRPIRSLDQTLRSRRVELASDVDEELDEPRTASRSRRIAVRILGGMAVLCAIAGLWRIAETERGRHAVLEWGTMGHAAEIDNAGKAIAQTIR